MNKKSLKFVNFTNLNSSELLEILEKRNSKEIRSKMVNDKIISEREHLSFCNSLKNDNSKLYFKVLLDDVFVGVMDFNNIDYSNHTYEPGSYFFCENNREIATHAASAICYLNLKLKLYHPIIYVKKSNIKAIIFNSMKLKNRIVREDDEYLYFTNDFTNLEKRTEAEVRADLAYLNRIYNLEFIL